MTANQADKTNDPNAEETAAQNKQNEEKKDKKSNVAKLRESYRDVKQEKNQLKGKVNELEDKVGKTEKLEEKINELEEKTSKLDEIEDQLAKQTLQQERKEQKQKFFKENSHLEEFKDEIENNVGDGDFKEEALLYMAKNKPDHLSQQQHNKTKTKNLGVSGTPNDNSISNTEGMWPDEYLEEIRKHRDDI